MADLRFPHGAVEPTKHRRDNHRVPKVQLDELGDGGQDQHVEARQTVTRGNLRPSRPSVDPQHLRRFRAQARRRASVIDVTVLTVFFFFLFSFIECATQFARRPRLTRHAPSDRFVRRRMK